MTVRDHEKLLDGILSTVGAAFVGWGTGSWLVAIGIFLIVLGQPRAKVQQ